MRVQSTPLCWAAYFSMASGWSPWSAQERAAFQLFPFEGRIGLARGEKEAVALVDLGEVDGQGFDAALAQFPVGRDGRLHDVGGAVANERVGLLARPSTA